MAVSNRTIFASCAVILFMAVLCCLGAAFSGITAFSLSDYKQKILATATPTLFPIHSLPGSNNSQGLPEEITGKMDEIQTQVIQIRGLIPKQSLNRELLSPAQLKQNVITDFLGEYTGEEARTDATVWTTLGLLKPDFDLISFYRDLYSEQIAGYYDDTDKEMYIVQGSGFGGQESSTYAHEYLHALQDQNYDLKNGLKFDSENCKLDTERCTGVQALIEGDATVTEQKWLTGYASSDTRQEILEFYTQFKSPVYDSAPEFMKRDFLFPYQSGSEFVFSLLDRGGWQAVDAAYLQPPASSEQIMHPDLYPDDKPIPVEIKDLSDIIGKDWIEIDGGVLGEWYTYLVFAWGYRPEYRIPDSEARIAAAGWGGDKYVVYQNQSDDSILFAQKIVLDTDLDAEQYWNTLLKYETMRWNEPSSISTNRVEWNASHDNVIIIRYGDNVYRVISPDRQLTSSVIESISR